MATKKYLDKIGLQYYSNELKKQVVISTEVREIVIVDEYPPEEKEGVLYLKVIQ